MLLVGWVEPFGESGELLVVVDWELAVSLMMDPKASLCGLGAFCRACVGADACWLAEAIWLWLIWMLPGSATKGWAAWLLGCWA